MMAPIGNIKNQLSDSALAETNFTQEFRNVGRKKNFDRPR